MKVYFHYSLLQRFKIPMNFSLQVRRNFLLQRFKIPLNFSLQVRRNFLLQRFKIPLNFSLQVRRNFLLHRFKIPLNFSLQVKRNILTMSFYLNDLIFVASLYYSIWILRGKAGGFYVRHLAQIAPFP